MSRWRGFSRLGERLRGRTPALYLALRNLSRLARQETLDPTWGRIAAALSPGELAVQAGPFAGMRYLPFAGGSGLLPKLVGSYEMELHAAVAESMARRPVRLINVGAAEGYYAVGYALRVPALEVHAFDVDVLARQRLRELGRLNGVAGRIHCHRECDHRQLEDLIVARTLIVCDCEGCEDRLLDARLAPRLAQADLMVELHVEGRPALAAALRARFAATHSTTQVPMTSRDAVGAAFAGVLSRLAPEDRGLALYERDAPTAWLWLRSAAWPGSGAR
ncbi:MAG TPA: hypothetical protein VHG32_23660 [Thermoanaerobaculia bacterium]|jgi:hypothetical protein|nr:hypothetical protein [Thermoanaerobaculia bacterium]